MSELKPCPFCGEMPEVEPNGDCYCDNYICPMAPDSYMPGDWNTRPIEDALKARITELSQAVGLITTLKPTMVMDAEHPLDMAKEVAEYVTARIAELEEENDRLQDAWFKDETICPDGSLKPKVSTLLSRIAELEALVERLIELGDVINGDKDSVWTLQTIKECWTEDVTKWKERE